MDGVLCDFSKAQNAAKKNTPEIAYPQMAYKFFEELEPIEGGIETVKLLQAHPEYEPHILTRPSINNPLCYTEKAVWIQKHFGKAMLHDMTISCQKDLLLPMGEYLIDDLNKGHGQEAFDQAGKLIHFGSERFPNWHAIQNFLKL